MIIGSSLAFFSPVDVFAGICCSDPCVPTCIPLAGPVAADQFEDGFAAANRGDYETALKLWQPLAQQGDSDVQFNLGVMYANGYCVPQDDATAMKRYRLAADQGNAPAHIRMLRRTRTPPAERNT